MIATSAQQSPLLRGAVALVYAGALLVVILWTQTQIDYRFDALGYIGAALQFTGLDAAAVHAETYRQVQAAVSPALFRELIGTDAYHADVYANANHFIQQLPFYHVRPLYNGLLALLHSAGLNMVHATILLAVTAYAAIGALLFVWLSRHLGPVYGAAAAWLLAASASMTEAARAGTVDLLSAAILIGALYALIEHRHVRALAGLLLLSLLARSDNIVLVAMFALYFAVAAPAALRPPRMHVASFALAAFALVAVVHASAGYYGWPVLFYHTFVTPLPAPADVSVSVTPAMYWRAIDMRLGSALTTGMPVFLACAVIAHALTRVGQPSDNDAALQAQLLRGVVFVLLANIAARIAAFPVVWDRQYIAHYLILAALMVAAAAAARPGAARSSAPNLVPLPVKRRRTPRQKAM